MPNLNVGLVAAVALLLCQNAYAIDVVSLVNCQTSAYGDYATACANAEQNMQNGTYAYETVCQNAHSGYPYGAILWYQGYKWLVCYAGNWVNIAPIVYQNSQDVYVTLSGTGVRTPVDITNSGYFECIARKTCADDASWLSKSNGVQYKRSGRTCPTTGTDYNACVGGTTTYRCAAGYYGYSSSGEPTCTKCSTTGFDAATSVADSRYITGCYLPIGTYTDSVGVFDITQLGCYYNP